MLNDAGSPLNNLDFMENTVKSLISGHLWVSQNLSVIERYPLFGGSFKKIVIFGTKCFVRYSWHVSYLGCPLVGGFNVYAHH